MDSKDLMPYEESTELETVSKMFPLRGMGILPQVSNQGSLIPESPETAVARNNPDEASKLLRELYNEKTQQVALASANKLCETYLTHLSEEKLENSKGVSVSFRRTFGDLVGLVTNEKKGFKLDIDLKE